MSEVSLRIVCVVDVLVGVYGVGELGIDDLTVDGLKK